MYRAAPRAVGLALLVALTACGGSSDDDKAAEAVSKNLMDESDSSFKVTQDQADCVGEGFVDELGVDKLKEYGIITEDLTTPDKSLDVKMSEGDAEDAAAVMVDCIDASELIKDAVLGGEDVDPAVSDCLDEAVSDDDVEAFIAGIFAGDESAAEDLMAPMQECMTG